MSEPNKPRLVIVMEGGVIQSVVADKPVDVMVVDYDTDGADPARLRSVPQVNAHGVVLGHHSAWVTSHFVEIETHGRWLPGIFGAAEDRQANEASDN